MEVGFRQQAGVLPSAGVADPGIALEGDNLFGNRAFVEGIACRGNRRFSAEVAASDFCVDRCLERLSPIFVDQELAHLRHASARKIDTRRTGPFIFEFLLQPGERSAQPRIDWEPFLGHLYRRLKHVFQPQTPKMLQRVCPRAERTRHGRRQKAIARDDVDLLCLEPLDGRGSGRVTLPVDGVDPFLPCTIDQDRHFAADAVRLRLEQVDRDPGGNTGIDCIAAFLEHAHARRGRKIVACRHDAEATHEHRSCCKCHGLVPHSQADDLPQVRLASRYFPHSSRGGQMMEAPMARPSSGLSATQSSTASRHRMKWGVSKCAWNAASST